MDTEVSDQEIELAAQKIAPRALKTDFAFAPKTLTFWRDSFLIFWIFSWIGHLAEFAWRALPAGVNGIVNTPDALPFFVVAAPYGFGVLALVWTIFPAEKWLKKHNSRKNSSEKSEKTKKSAEISRKKSLKNPAKFSTKIREKIHFPQEIGIGATFFAGAFLGALVEFLSAALITLILGKNPFWDYSTDAFNLFGFVCLRNSLAFGAISVAVIFWLFPMLNNFLRDFAKRFPRTLNAIFWTIFISYSAIQIGRFF